MMGIVFATEAEALPFLELGGFKEVVSAPLRLLASHRIAYRVVISGMGKVAAALATQWMIAECRPLRLVHAGICGALGDPAAIRPGTVFRVTSASEGFPGPGIPSDSRECAHDLWRNLPAAALVTVERPVFDDGLRAELRRFGDLVDMEGAVVARVADLYGLPCSILKGVTDFAGSGERSMLQSRLPAVSAAIAQCLWEEMVPHASG
jgi:adenosylhomocysteine nucleosidase